MKTILCFLTALILLTVHVYADEKTILLQAGGADVKAEAAKGRRKSFKAFLAKVPSATPMAGDEKN